MYQTRLPPGWWIGKSPPSSGQSARGERLGGRVSTTCPGTGGPSAGAFLRCHTLGRRLDGKVERFDTLDVEGFVLSDSDSARGATRHFGRHHDLGMEVRKALEDSGDEQAVLVITLGIDDHDSHRVEIDYRSGVYGEGAFSVVEEAIETLEVISEQLRVMQATPGVRWSERRAYDRGREAERSGVTKVHEGA